MIVGYMVLYVVRDLSVNESLWGRRTMYATWEKALEKAKEMVDEIKGEDNDNSFVLHIKEGSKDDCERYGKAYIYQCLYRGYEIANMYIVPVYDD